MSGVATSFASQFEAGHLLRVVQRLPCGIPGNDVTVTVKKVVSNTKMVVEESTLAGAGSNLDEDLVVTSFLGYKKTVN